MTVEDVIEAIKGACVIQFDPNSRYLLILNRNQTTQQVCGRLAEAFSRMGLPPIAILTVSDPENAARLLRLPE